jgi:glutamate-1-semialdehyde 2,1-aminomutase
MTLWQKLNFPRRLWQRLQLSRAKHPSLTGHPRIALRLARLLPEYGYSEDEALRVDGAPVAVQAQRRAGLDRLAALFRAKAPTTLRATKALATRISDMQLIGRYRVPFQFREVIAARFELGSVVAAAEGVRLRDLDGNWSYDLGGSYGVNVFGNGVYRQFIERAVARAEPVGLVLGSYHPVVADNVERLCALSGLDEVSFHMSGTEAVMQAVRLARYHTGRTHVVRFVGAYHGWWDGVQAGPGNPLPVDSLYTLPELSERTLDILRTRDDIACVLVNPLQALTPNKAPATDSALVTGERSAAFDKVSYAQWLQRLRDVCSERGIALIFDEVFLGFRLARGGAQEYFGVRADIVTYGKTLGGGFPVGVVCGRSEWMRRYKPGHPGDLCLARGTFNAHPYVMTAMNEFLRFIDTREAQATWHNIDERWNARAARWNQSLSAADLPIRVVNMTSVFTTTFTQPGRYHWLLQYYLRAEGLALPWIGTGRFIFSHDYTDADFDEVIRRFVRAAVAMRDDGYFWLAPAATAATFKAALRYELLRAFRDRGRVAKPAVAHPLPIAVPVAATPAAQTALDEADGAVSRAA